MANVVYDYKGRQRREGKEKQGKVKQQRRRDGWWRDFRNSNLLSRVRWYFGWDSPSPFRKNPSILSNIAACIVSHMFQPIRKCAAPKTVKPRSSSKRRKGLFCMSFWRFICRHYCRFSSYLGRHKTEYVQHENTTKCHVRRVELRRNEKNATATFTLY